MNIPKYVFLSKTTYFTCLSSSSFSQDQRKNAQTGPIMRKADQSEPNEEGEWINK